MIIVAGTIRFDPSRRDEAQAVVDRARTATSAEPGNQAYEFALDIADESVIHVFELWESQEALDAHFQTPHLAELMASFGDLGVSDASLTRYDVERSTPLM